MMSRRRMLLSLIAALMSALAVYGLYYVQLQRVQAEERVSVVVPNDWIDAGQFIAAEQLSWLSIPLSLGTGDMIYAMEEIVGQEAVLPLGANEPILQWKLNQYALHPNEQQATFQIPKEYIKAISNGIRAGDEVWIYVSSSEGVSERLFQEAIVVASVKTGANHEVDVPDEAGKHTIVRNNAEQMYASRRQANGMIEHINVNLTEEQWLELDTICQGGESKLVIAYHSLPTPVKGQMRNE
jgi:hypothetical protein